MTTTRLAEYRVTAATRSRVVRLNAAWSPTARATVALEAYTAGWEPAGSMARWTEAGFAVRWSSEGARLGQRFRDQTDAYAYFARLTASDDDGED